MNIRTLNEFSAKNVGADCLLCHNPSCTNNCPHGFDPAKVIRSFRFDNINGACESASFGNICKECESQDCKQGCIRSKVDKEVDIPSLIVYLNNIKKDKKDIKKRDLSIDFCGLTCENPFFLSSSVVASNYDMVARAFEMGWAGVAFKTIGNFVPEEVSPRFAITPSEINTFAGFKNIEQISDHTLEENIEFLTRLKKDYPSKIIIASIMGRNEDEWTLLAKKMTEAGVDIIECNFSCPHMSGEGLGSDVGQNPELVSLYTKATRKGTHLPILAKMTANIGNMEIPAVAAIKGGATGIAAINTIKSIMNINLDNFVSEPDVDGKSSVGGYSGKAVKPIALRFIHDMKKHPLLKNVPISGMGGIETWRDGAEFMALGCENLQITTSVMQYGYRIIDDLIDGLSTYLEEQNFNSLSEMVGMALPNIVPSEELNRHSICYPKFNTSKCIGCGRCYLSCLDGGHQALEQLESGKPKLIPNNCVGCQLCSVVCPVGAISPGKRVNIKAN